MMDHITWAFEQPIRGGKKLTLLALAYKADSSGRCNISQKAISELTGQSRTSVSKQATALERDGYIERFLRHSEDGGRLADGYELLVKGDVL